MCVGQIRASQSTILRFGTDSSSSFRRHCSVSVCVRKNYIKTGTEVVSVDGDTTAKDVFHSVANCVVYWHRLLSVIALEFGTVVCAEVEKTIVLGQRWANYS